MTSIELTSITGSITTPYQIFACDVYGNNCILIATIGTTVPPSNTIILPSQFNTAPAVGIKIVTFDGCERFETFNCSVLPPTSTPTMTHTPTPTPTPTGIMLNNYLVTQCGGIGVEVISVPSLSGYYLGSDGNCWQPLYLSLDPPTISYVNTYNNCLECLGITLTPTQTQTLTPTPTQLPAARFSGGFGTAVNSFGTVSLPSGTITLTGVPNDTLTIEVTWPSLNSMTGTTVINSITLTEDVTSTFTVTLDSLGVGQITGTTSRIGTVVYGQKLMRFTLISSLGSNPIIFGSSAIFRVIGQPTGGAALPGSITNYISSGTSCSSITAQTSYVITTTTPIVGNYLYDNTEPSPGIPINGGNNWISVWGFGCADFTSPTNKYSLQVSPTGQILNVVPC